MRPEAHFYMSNTGNNLRCAYTHTVEWTKVREALRSARSRAQLTLDEAASQSGLNRATIHSIENVKREPELKPELETIEALAITYGLTLSLSFAQLEDLQPSALKSDPTRGDNDASKRPEVEDGTIATLPESLALKALILGLNETLTSVANRVAAGLEQLTNPRRSKTRARTARHPGRRKVG